MEYQIVLTPKMAEELRAHLLHDRECEQMAVVLCGLDRRDTCTRLLGRHLVTFPPDAFDRQSAVGLELSPEAQRQVLQLAAREGLSQVDFHTHPGDGPNVDFSATDDRNERLLARYLDDRLPGTVYGSVVTNGSGFAARVWELYRGEAIPVSAETQSLTERSEANLRGDDDVDLRNVHRFDRQVRAFGRSFQARLRRLRLGVVGVGGIGSVFTEEAARLGVRDWVLVDHDVVEESNLNRLLGATPQDVAEELAKVDIAARNIRAIEPAADVLAIRSTVFTERALQALKTCDVLVAATDNDASRLVVNALAAQYLIPILHVGVNIDVEDGDITDVSGEVALPPLGTWCLLCAGMIDPTRAAMDLARPEERQLLAERGYVAGVHAPAVYHLNAVVASLAVAELHNLVSPYRRLRRYLIYRDLEGELMTVGVPAGERCPHCGPDGRLGLGDLAPLWRPQRHTSILPDAADAETVGMTNLIETDEEALGEGVS